MQNFNKFLLFKKIQNEINPRDNSITLNFMSYNMLHFKLDLRLFFFSHSSKFNNSLDFFIFSVMPKLIFFIFFFFAIQHCKTACLQHAGLSIIYLRDRYESEFISITKRTNGVKWNWMWFRFPLRMRARLPALSSIQSKESLWHCRVS